MLRAEWGAGDEQVVLRHGAGASEMKQKVSTESDAPHRPGVVKFAASPIGPMQTGRRI